MIDKLTHEDQKNEESLNFILFKVIYRYLYISLMTLFESRLVVQLVFHDKESLLLKAYQMKSGNNF